MKNKGFSLIELLVVMAIISMLAAMLLPTFQTAREKAKYARWLGYKNNLRADPSLVAYWTFENAKTVAGIYVENMATIGDFNTSTIDFSSYSDPEKMDGEMNLFGLGGWTKEGRWTGKNALYFDGSNDYVDCGNDQSLNITDEITIEAWVKVSSWRNWGRIVSARFNDDNKRYVLSLGNNSNIQGYFDSYSSSNGKGTPAGGIELNQWYHVAMTSNANVVPKIMEIYIDGEIQTPLSNLGAIYLGSADRLTIGENADYPGNPYPFNGLIGEVAIYNRALDALEIKNHYEMGRP